MPRRHAGYTLSELIIVIVVTGVFVILAFSAYRTYVVRAEVAQSIAQAAEIRASIEAAFADGDTLAGATIPPDMGSRGQMGVGSASLEVVNGRIDIVFGERQHEAIGGRRLSLTPYETADLEIVWICGNAIPGPGLKPLGFSAGGPQAVQLATSVERRYLPRECR
jgi:type IV pilus assembly protein PilA